MQHQRRLAGLVLSWLPCSLALNPYLFDPDNNLRPDNATNLDYTRYDKIGSYYNGTLSFSFNLEDLPDSEAFLWNGDVCDEYVNDTMEVSLDAMLAIQKRPKDDKLDNPFLLVLQAWDGRFDLGPADKTANYSQYQSFQTWSQQGDELKWEFDMLERDNPFAFKGFMANNSLLAQDWRFNLTDKCQSTVKDELLFLGHFLYPADKPHYDWVDDSIPPVTIAGEFNDLTAAIYIDGLFEGLGVNTKLAGALRIRFLGQVDNDRSDRLLLDGREPAWEPVLGFREEDGDDDSSGISVAASSLMAFGAGMCVMGLLLL